MVDMSSIAPSAGQELAAELAKKGVSMLNAPVSGGEPRRSNASLAIMVGGPVPVFEAVKDILAKWGRR